jgi:translation elongation factor EF-G
MQDIFEGVIDEIIEHFYKTNIGLASMKITVYDGTFHEVDSNRLVYKIATKKALRKVLDTAKFVRR